MVREKTRSVIDYIFDNSTELERSDLIHHLVEVEKAVAIERTIVVKELEKILTQGTMK